MNGPHWRLSSLVVALASLAASAAGAADVPTTKAPPAPAPLPPPFNWTGFYFGGNIGGAWGMGSPSVSALVNGVPAFTNFIPTRFGSEPTSWIGGVQAGYNYQYGQAVVGIEGDIDWTDLSRQATTTITGAAAPFSVTSTGMARLDWIGTLRGRVGYAFAWDNRMLVYGTGGLAYAGVTNAGTVTFNTIGQEWSATNNPTAFGWTVGGGLEYALTDNVTIRGEYLFYDLSNEKFTTAANGPAAAAFPATFTIKTDYQGSIARAGVNVKW
ncbi:MAG: porin family protein [Hyphomicrobiales bacterium]|nr:porin family protein [Hyphomicrobiales bacterium]